MMIYLANNIPVPSAFKVNALPDTLTYDEAMADPDRDCWLESMLVEIPNDLVRRALVASVTESIG